ncbi:TrkA family potassium uptake protein [Arthrobacter sp. zg-Y820]|uniref:potassium channel family protein n=1 Tax=unclassified Arthrobacter TaxID=235627 RepID=UPI001E4EAB3D|nr:MULTISPECIES: TrkA family potassium uptake protein [unclassified Arthrobacter]MCC9196851.1 TrkA family potassium uptake protein [Arthrobacter sp. zg-Y820]MDK1279714.1 TrkA family potassium uptake protein [Arthrobacter sp. zg.Y820]MDK1358679.1 TrkA family potassium uptake protein [Arthrobacter sp. zg-Y1219]WIB07916.1 TrkA family potassium uptake protein [Arthrobacter sp. zg-Y820]
MARFSFLGARDPGHARADADAVAVLGLGRFGESVALELMAEGTEVLGVDSNGEVVQRLDGRLTLVVTADCTDTEVLDQLSVSEFNRVVLGITSDIAASVLTASQLVRSGVAQVWAAAASEQHGLILDQIGVHHVVYPEQDMGRRVAHLVRASLLEYIRVGEDFAVAETVPHGAVVGVPLDPGRVQEMYGVSIIARRSASGPWEFAGAGMVLTILDRILIAGPPERTDAFSQPA